MSLPATPGQAAPEGQQPQAPSQPATPGTNQASDNSQPPAQQAVQPQQPGGTVSISNEEYAQLQRDRARLKGLQQRTSRGTKKQIASPGDQNYDENEALAAERNKNLELEQRLFQRDVKDGVRDLLAKPEYANLPESTRKLIVRNPHALSEAGSLEEVLLDVEDFLREESAAMKTFSPQQPVPPGQPQQQFQQQQVPGQPQQQFQQQQFQQQQVPGHETPPQVAAGSPQPPPANQLEDVNNLVGSARSRAVLRNAIKKARGVQG